MQGWKAQLNFDDFSFRRLFPKSEEMRLVVTRIRTRVTTRCQTSDWRRRRFIIVVAVETRDVLTVFGGVLIFGDFFRCLREKRDLPAADQIQLLDFRLFFSQIMFKLLLSLLLQVLL